MDESERSSFTDFLTTIQNYEEGDDVDSFEGDGSDDDDDSFEEAPDSVDEDEEEEGSEDDETEYEEGADDDDDENEDDEEGGEEYEEDDENEDEEDDDDDEEADDDDDDDEEYENEDEDEDAEEYEEDGGKEEGAEGSGSEEYDSDDDDEMPPVSHVDAKETVDRQLEEEELEDDEESDDENEADDDAGDEYDEDGEGEDEDAEDEDAEDDDDDDDDGEDEGTDNYEEDDESEEKSNEEIDYNSKNLNDESDENSEVDFQDEDDDDSDDKFKDEDDDSDDDNFRDEDDDSDNDSKDVDDDSDNDSKDESDDDSNDDTSRAGFDEDDENNTFNDGADDSDSDNDGFADEFDPWSKGAQESLASDQKNTMTQRDQRARGRIGRIGGIGRISLPKGRSSRWFFLVVAVALCGGILVLILYFAGVGPFGSDDVSSPTEAPSLVTEVPTTAPTISAAPTITTAPTITISPSAPPVDPDGLQEIAVKPNYQVIVPSGLATNVTIQSLSVDLINLMDVLAPEVLIVFADSGKTRRLRERRRNLQAYSVKLPTSIAEINAIDCPTLAAADSLCADVLANVVLVYETNPDFLEGYQAALESALDNGELESHATEAGSDIGVIVFGVGPIPSPSPSITSQPTVTSQPTGPPVVAAPVLSNIPTRAPSPVLSNIPTRAPSNGSSLLPSSAPFTGPSDSSSSPAPSTGVPPLESASPSIAPTIEATELVSPIRFYVIAGDSNVVGFADLNHLVGLSFSDPSFGRFVTPSFAPVELSDAFVSFKNEYGNIRVSLDGPLSTQYGTDGGHFGPEVGMGFDLADEFDENIVIVKGGGTGGSLAEDWLPPSSGGPGSFYTQLVGDIKDAMTRVTEFAGANDRPAQFAGLVWFHGYDDAFNNIFRAAYETNLQNLITDIRAEFALPDLPIVIAELGGQGATPDAAELEMRQIQKRVVDVNAYTVLTATSQLVTGFDTSSPAEIFDGVSNYWGRADVMIQIGYHFAADILAAKLRDASVII